MNHVNGALAGLGPEELRAAVRAVLAEVLPAGTAGEAVPGGSPELPGHGEVVVSTDADLTALLRRVAALCEDPQQRAALQDGRHGFRLARQDMDGGLEARKLAPQPPSMRIERGAVTERTVLKAAASGARLQLGRGAVLTPLARDKARSLGVEIEKEH